LGQRLPNHLKQIDRSRCVQQFLENLDDLARDVLSDIMGVHLLEAFILAAEVVVKGGDG